MDSVAADTPESALEPSGFHVFGSLKYSLQGQYQVNNEAI
jgi:hypothetical protein